MKMRKKLFPVFLILIFLSTPLVAQKYKFGHIDTQKLLQSMPESDTARAKMEKATRELEKELEQMQVELNNKVNDYIQRRDSLSPLLRQTKETEIQDMQQRVQRFQMSAEQDLQNQREKLFQPIYDKMDKAIKKVAKEKGFTYIFDVSMGSLAYFSEESIDVMPDVAAELGIQ
jgi:outer membrane protein